jgi:hypothetical protein
LGVDRRSVARSAERSGTAQTFEHIAITDRALSDTRPLIVTHRECSRRRCLGVEGFALMGQCEENWVKAHRELARFRPAACAKQQAMSEPPHAPASARWDDVRRLQVMALLNVRR